MTTTSSHHKIEKNVYFLIERKRYDQAESLLTRSLKGSPDDHDLLYYLAYVYSETDRNQEASTILSKILGQDPENDDAGFLLAHVFKDLKRYADAEQLLLGLLHSYPESAVFYVLYAEIMLETMHVDKARALAKEAMRLEPDSISAQSVMVICDVIKNKKADYRQRLSDLVRQYPETYGTSSMVLLVLYEQKKYREALRIAQELLRSDPGNESLVDTVKELKVLTHVTMIPLMPGIKFGWYASAVMWVLALITMHLSREYLSQTTSLMIISGWVFYVVYSWFYPRFLEKIIT